MTTSQNLPRNRSLERLDALLNERILAAADDAAMLAAWRRKVAAKRELAGVAAHDVERVASRLLAALLTGERAAA